MAALVTATLLVFSATFIGHVNTWLGPAGEGLMDAFNPAELHIAAQPMGQTTIEQVEQIIEGYSNITDTYMLAMPNVSVDGVDCTANVITEPRRFHLLSGRTCDGPDDVVLTEFMAADLGISIGDTAEIQGPLGTASYTVSGIHQCANDMGANIGLSREGYARIGNETPQMWCYHYFISDPSLQPAIMQALEDAWGTDVYLHENSWPGLAGILQAMQVLLWVMYALAAAVILLSTYLASARIFAAERKDAAIFRVLGLTRSRLRLSFMLRFTAVALCGSGIGMVAAALLIDPLAGALMRSFGISSFAAVPSVQSILLPPLAITALCAAAAWLVSARIRHVDLQALREE